MFSARSSNLVPKKRGEKGGGPWENEAISMGYALEFSPVWDTAVDVGRGGRREGMGVCVCMF